MYKSTERTPAVIILRRIKSASTIFEIFEIRLKAPASGSTTKRVLNVILKHYRFINAYKQ